METEKVLNDTQAGVVDPKQSDADVTGASTEQVPGSAEPEKKPVEAPAKPQQSEQDNAKFAEQRRAREAAEAAAKAAKEEAERYKAEIESYKRLTSEIKSDYESDSDAPDELYVAALAQKSGKSKADVRAELQKQNDLEAQRYEKQKEADPAYKEAMRKAAEYDKEQSEKQVKADLAEIKAKYPDETAENVKDLGELFLSLRTANVDNLKAYEFIRSQRSPVETKPEETQPETGAVNTSGTEYEKETYNSAELDKFSQKQLVSNPSLLEKAVKSLSKLKKQT